MLIIGPGNDGFVGAQRLYGKPWRGSHRDPMYGPAAIRNGFGLENGSRFYVSGLLIGSRAVVSHGPKLNFVQLCGRMRMTLAAWINSVRR